MRKVNLEYVITDLRKSLAWLDLVLATLNEGVITLEDDMKIHFANDALAEMLGKDRIFLLGNKIWDAIPFAHNGKILKKKDYQQALQTNNIKSLSGLYNLKTTNSNLIVDVAFEYIPKINQIVLVVRDSTKLKQEETIVLLQQYITVAANEATVVQRAVKKCVQTICQQIGWSIGHVYFVNESSPDDLISTNIWHFDNKSKFKKFREITDKTRLKKGIGLPGTVLKTGEPIWIADLHQDKNFPRLKVAKDLGIKSGIAFPVVIEKEVVAILEFFSVEVIQVDKQLLQVLAHIGTQLGRIFERKRREEQKLSLVREQTARYEAEASQERYRRLLESTNVIPWESDAATRKFTYVGPQAEKILGYPIKDWYGETFWPDHIHPDDRKWVLKFCFDCIITKNEYEFEYRMLTKQGNIIWIRDIVSVTNKKNGQKVLTGFFLDITQRKELERQKDEFIGIASHELKTPVTSIKAFAQVMLNRFIKAGDKDSALYLQKMNAQLNKLTSLIGDLLDVTKIETGKLQFHEDWFDFNTLIHEIVEEMQRTTEKQTMIKQLKETKTVYADRDRIGQVITNLLSNAIKYSPRSDKIILKTFTDKETITLCVQDFGVGISEENKKNVFERFYRETGAKQETFPGMGLGLYICKEIIKRHSGSIWVESEKEKGSTFCFRLPIIRTVQKTRN